MADSLRRQMDLAPGRVVACPPTFRHRPGAPHRRAAARHLLLPLVFALALPGLLSAQTKNEYIIEHTLRLSKGKVHAALFSPDQKRMLTIGNNSAIRILEVETGRVIRNIRTGTHQAVSAVFHPKENVVFTGGKDRTVKAWDLGNSQVSLTLEGHQAPISVLRSGSEGKFLFSGSQDGKVMAWDVEEKKAVRIINAHRGRVSAMALHPDGKHLATGGQDRKIVIWEWKTGKQITELTGHLGRITAIDFAPKPEVIVSASTDGTIKLWQWEERGKQDFATLLGHKRAVTGVAFHPNGRWIISGSVDETIKIWRVDTNQIVQELTLVDGAIASINLSSNGNRLIAAYQKDRARTWKLEKSAFLAALGGHTQSVFALDFTKDNQFLLSASQDKTVKIWNLRTRAMVRTYPTQNHQVQAARFAPDDRSFATGGADGQVQIRDTAKGKVSLRLRGHTGKVNSLAYHPQGKVLVSGGSDKTWVLWELPAGRPIKRVSAHKAQINAMDFAADGTSFASGSDDNTVRVWTYPEGKLLHTLMGHTGSIRVVRFDPKNRYLASGANDGVIKIWDLKTGKIKFDFTGHDFIVSSLVFAPDGRALISVSRDKTVKLWDLQTGKFLRTVSGERDQILAVAMGSDGQVIATGSIGPKINLMVYPLKVVLAEEEAKQKAPAEPPPVEAPVAVADDTPKPEEKDLSALADGQDPNAAKLTYKSVDARDPQAELEKLERELDKLMSIGRFCRDEQQIDALANRILLLAPYDKAAYHALLITAIVRQDLKMIYLMSKIGRKALFFRRLYSYDFPQAVDAKLDFWQQTVFNQARHRAGRELELEFVACDGTIYTRSLPVELLAVDIPQEAMAVIASKRVKVDFKAFKNASNEDFANRVFHLVERAMEAKRQENQDASPVVLSFDKVQAREAGVLNLDLSAVDLVGFQGRLPFKLRLARGNWFSYFTDKDRRKQILLPTGNYYLMVNNKVMKAFSIAPSKSRQIAVNVVRR
ncbi:MAG: WD40 repeat domain-containing protein [SAR324 cluster bacterium]|nr:WD40 repeat domain-containing protein [SAR324 cluster bacterium]